MTQNFRLKSNSMLGIVLQKLMMAKDELENSGDCEINGHELAAFISPQKVGTYRFKYIYEIAGETWVDNVKIKAG